jgi:hypothetical protein
MNARMRWSTWLFGVALACVSLLAACGGSHAGFSGFEGPSGNGGTGNPQLGGDGGTFGGGGAGGHDSGPPQPPSMTACQACAAAGGQCQNNVCTITENPGNVNAGAQGQLMAGGSADPAFAWLYPYDKTVFPRGLLPPTMQFGGTAPDATYVKINFATLNYEGFYGPSSPGRVAFSAGVWNALTLLATAQDTVEVSVTKMSGGQVSGPITENWSIAQGSLRGTIYYETYDSELAGGLGSVGIMQIQPGAPQPAVVKSGCGNVCHTASANGSTLVANTVLSLGSASYDLTNNAALLWSQPGETFTYGGLYPDGSLLMSATDYRTWVLGFGGTVSGLYDSHTGANIPAPGWDGVISRGGTTTFSPDGTHLAFNHEDTGGGHTLAVMDFALATHAFSNLADIATDPNNTLAWPAFTPDSKWVVYHAGSNEQFETDQGASGDVFIVDLATHTVHRLDALDGYTGAGSQSYLPANDSGLSFAPTVLPEAVGGYFWVVFTTHRSYGNTLPSMMAGPDGPDEYGKLWVAALDLSPTPGQDASHPAFYLDGQEANADNLRGFWVLSPCKQDGATCVTGDQCCGGYCEAGDGGALACGSSSGGCSHEYEKCMTAADCCDPSDECINGLCAEPAPQ